MSKMVAARRLHQCWGRPPHQAPGHRPPGHPGPGGWGHDVSCDHVTHVCPGQFAQPGSWCYKPLSPLPRALDAAAVAWVNTWDFLSAHLGLYLCILSWCQDETFFRKRIFFLRPLHNILCPSPGLRWRRLHLQCDQVPARARVRRESRDPGYLQRLLVASPGDRPVVVRPPDADGAVWGGGHQPPGSQQWRPTPRGPGLDDGRQGGLKHTQEERGPSVPGPIHQPWDQSRLRAQEVAVGQWEGKKIRGYFVLIPFWLRQKLKKCWSFRLFVCPSVWSKSKSNQSNQREIRALREK